MKSISYVTQLGIHHPTKHYLFVTWRMMNVRCYDPNHKAYHRYGGRGISVTDELRWDSPTGFISFLKSVGDRPKGMTLDRINNEVGYLIGNMRWATKRTQQNNMGIGLSNTSGSMGVCWNKAQSFWIAQIECNGKGVVIGNFNKDDKNIAIDTYNRVKSHKLEFGDDSALALIKSLSPLTPTGKRTRRNKTSDYYGVAWDSKRSKWVSMTSYRETENGKLINKFLGRYDNEIDAYRAVLKFLEWVDLNNFVKKVRQS